MTSTTAPLKKSFKAQMLEARETAITASVNRLLAEKGFDAMTVDEVAATFTVYPSLTGSLAEAARRLRAFD